MNKHYMHLHPGPFTLIRDGNKTVELRLNDEKRKLINKNDLIIFLNLVTNEISVVEVNKITKHHSFVALYEYYDPQVLGYFPGEIVDPNDMAMYYTSEDIMKYGVLAISFRMIEVGKQ